VTNTLTGSHDNRVYHSSSFGSPFVLMDITKIENGLLIRLARAQGEVSRTYFVDDLDQVPGVIAANIANWKMEGKL